jgi:hypothetical protein
MAVCHYCKGSGVNRHSGHKCDHCDFGVFRVRDQVMHWVAVLLSVAALAGLCEWAWKALHR